VEAEEKRLREWSKIHNVPGIRYLILLLDRERASHGVEAHSYLACIKREKRLMKLLDGQLCPKCRKEPKVK
jgi:hypothetical protein